MRETHSAWYQSSHNVQKRAKTRLYREKRVPAPGHVAKWQILPLLKTGLPQGIGTAPQAANQTTYGLPIHTLGVD